MATGAALVGLVVAFAVGHRIGSGLVRLTAAAEGIQRGELSVRAAVESPDEVGVLGGAFDSMATSIESLAGELRQAIDDEVALRNRLETVVAGMSDALLAVDEDGPDHDLQPGGRAAHGSAVIRRPRPRRAGRDGTRRPRRATICRTGSPGRPRRRGRRRR